MRLRIISGEFKGRLIDAPQTELTRPTTDRVRESIFNYLANQISLDEIAVLDIFSGSGSLGLEALSRGAASVIFIEKNFVPAKTLSGNISKLGVDAYCTVRKQSGLAFVKSFSEYKFDLILADPPFFSYDIHEIVSAVKTRKLLKPDAPMIIERSIQTKDRDVKAFGFEPYRQIGDTCLYQLTGESEIAESSSEEIHSDETETT